MRISDWSSDVCSSDLRNRAARWGRWVKTGPGTRPGSTILSMNAVSAPVDAAAASADRLRITEIFLSLQGEARDAGWPTVFVRLTGCPLRCQYCDTAYAFHGGQWRDIDEIGRAHV